MGKIQERMAAYDNINKVLELIIKNQYQNKISSIIMITLKA